MFTKLALYRAYDEVRDYLDNARTDVVCMQWDGGYPDEIDLIEGSIETYLRYRRTIERLLNFEDVPIEPTLSSIVSAHEMMLLEEELGWGGGCLPTRYPDDAPNDDGVPF